jgi:hypothetical protein
MFGSMPPKRPARDVRKVLDLKERGLTDREVSEAAGVPINTIRGWLNHGFPQRVVARRELGPRCPVCYDDPHEVGCDPNGASSHLLGVYLANGCLARNGASWTLRVTVDGAYPGIISECVGAMQSVSGDRFVGVRPHHTDVRVEVSCTWRRWLCLARRESVITLDSFVGPKY